MRNPVSRFAYSQSDIGIKRSQFSRDHDHKTTLSAGLLYPIMVDEVLPGDTYSVDLSSLIRMSTPIHPVMDNAFLDVYFFFVPNRIIWDHWKEFMGESPEDPYINPIEYSVPQFNKWHDFDTGVIPEKSLLDYLGVPSNTTPREFMQLPVRAYCKIWNEWFRDQNLQNAIALDTGDSDLYPAEDTDDIESYFWDNNNRTDPESYVINAAHGGDLAPVNKYHDYFTSALKQPQKGPAVPIPLNGFAPVYGSDLINIASLNVDDTTLKLTNSQGSNINGSLRTSSGRVVTDAGVSAVGPTTGMYVNNLAADLSLAANAGVYATITDLRYAFQLQKFLEADNRGGTRYREILKQHFNVTSPDASIQIPEFLGGKRIPINISQVLQTSASSDVSPQGNTAAYSLTSDKLSAFTKSFTEHGFIMAVACIRTEHTYCQGLERMWSRKNKFSYFFPEFANVSEQPILNKEIFLDSGDASSLVEQNGVFGFQEAWAEYRYKPNRVSGEFRPTYSQSLDIWHYGDYYTMQPYLSSEWIRETRANIDRTLAVSSDLSDQFICDFYFKLKTTRAMPVYSIPGLADHH